jgi:GT2 family glycosyltransferase
LSADPRVEVVVLTHDRPAVLARTLDRLLALPERPRVVVVDNASREPGTERVARSFPSFEYVRCDRNRGAAGRNDGVARVRAPYVAFCDDDTFWAPGALRRAADLLDAHPRVAAVGARVLVGASERVDPICEEMARSPLRAAGTPGAALISFLPGAVVFRTAAYREAGGYEPRLGLGAEEGLLGLELAARGWRMVYAADVITHHHPASMARARRRRAVHTLRNRVWIAWLRLPVAGAVYESRRALRDADERGLRGAVLRASLRGAAWLLAKRRVVSEDIYAQWCLVHGGPSPQHGSRDAVCTP